MTPAAISDQYPTFVCFECGHFGSPIWAIMDDRKSLLIAFLAISDKPATLFGGFFFQNGRQFWSSDLRHYVLSMAMPNMKLIGEFLTK